MRQVWSYARRSASLLGLPALLAAGGYMAWARLWPDVWVWRNASAAVVASVFLLGPLAAGLAAWDAGRDRRRRTDYLHELAGRQKWAGPAASLSATTAWPLAAYLAILAAVFIPTAAGATWGTPMLGWVATGALGLVLHSVLGFVAGRVLPRWFTAPLVCFGAYVLAVALTSWSGWWEYLPAATVQTQDVFFDTNSVLIAGQALWYAGLALAALGTWVAWQTTRRARAVGVPLLGLVASVVGLSVLVMQDGRFSTTPTTFDYDCAGQRPIVCVHPAFHDALPGLRRAIDPVAARLAGTPFALHRVEQRVRGVGGTPSPGAVAIYIDDMSPGWARRDIAEMFDHMLALPATGLNACERNDATLDRARPDQYSKLVASWVLGEPTIFHPATPAGRTAAAWFRAQSDATRRAWLSDHATGFRRCTLAATDFT